MRAKLVGLILFFSSAILSFSFSDPEQHYKYEQYFKGYKSDQQKIIRNNWGQYFAADINKDLAAEYNLFSLRVDSYGSVYPDDAILTDITENDFAGTLSPKNLISFSFYGLFSSELTRPQIKKNLKLIKDDERYKQYEQLLNIAEIGTIDDFTQKWDSIFTPLFEAALQKQLTPGKKLVFFIHGYNVPYSLASIQCKEFINLSQKTAGIRPADYLFVPVYWPSNAMKRSNIDEKDFDISDVTGLPGLKNGMLYLYNSNRAYYAALTLREVINSLPVNDTNFIRIFSHSLGATVATTALINTTSKLDPRWLGREPINDDLKRLMSATHLPERKIKVCMNAPAIPGVSTFEDMDTVITKKYYYFMMGYNPEDTMVTKHIIPGDFSKAHQFSSSTLAADADGEVEKTQELFENFSDHFFALRSGEQTDHDIFAYSQQAGYKSLLISFFKE